jgi:Fe-S oxidoreductase
MILPVLQSLVTLALLLAAFGFLFVRLERIAVLVNTGGRSDEPLTDRPAQRAAKVASLVLGQKKTLEDPWAGVLHVLFLYGFLILGIGHVEIVLEGLTAFLRAFGHEPFSYAVVLTPPLYSVYHLSQDLLAAAVIVASVIALVRRLSGRVARLIPRSQDAENILWFIVALYVTFFAFMGSSLLVRLRAAGDSVGFVAHQPVSSLVAGALSGLGDPALGAFRDVAWWAHVLVFLAFAAYIPLNKHMHLVFATPNIWFFRRQRYGLPARIDFEKTEKFGVDKVQELPWKSLLDSFACTECGRCNAVCPAHATGKPLLPMKVLHDVKMNLQHENGPDILRFRDARGRPVPGREEEEAAAAVRTPLVAKDAVARDEPGAIRADGAYLKNEGRVHVDELWACTTCAACVEACPVLVDSVPGTLVSLRQSLVMMESDFPQEATTAFKGMEVQGNPWGAGQDRRAEWMEGLDVPVMAQAAGKDPGHVFDYLFWVGCAGATDPRARKTQQALVRILRVAGVDFAVLGPEEKCTGDPARRMGNEYLFQQLAQENIETLGKYRFRKILVTCPHCLNSLGKEYRELGGTYDVVHHSQLLAELLAAGRVPLDEARKVEDVITFHDPCYLGRYSRTVEPPREILARIGARTVEMERSREHGFCCGAGGGRIFLEEKIGVRVNVERTSQAMATGAKTVAVGCPFCMTMITDGTKAKNVEEDLRVADLAELVAERLRPGS